MSNMSDDEAVIVRTVAEQCAREHYQRDDVTVTDIERAAEILSWDDKLNARRTIAKGWGVHVTVPTKGHATVAVFREPDQWRAWVVSEDKQQA